MESGPPRPCEQKIEDNLKIFMSVPPNLVRVNIIYYVHYTHELGAKQLYSLCFMNMWRSWGNFHFYQWNLNFSHPCRCLQSFRWKNYSSYYVMSLPVKIHQYDNSKYFSILKKLRWPLCPYVPCAPVTPIYIFRSSVVKKL